jgi:hypothetical protein
MACDGTTAKSDWKEKEPGTETDQKKCHTRQKQMLGSGTEGKRVSSMGMPIRVRYIYQLTKHNKRDSQMSFIRPPSYSEIGVCRIGLVIFFPKCHEWTRIF